MEEGGSMSVYDKTNCNMMYEVFYDRAKFNTQVMSYEYLDTPYPHANDFSFPNRWDVERLADFSQSILGTWVHPTFAITEETFYRSLDGRKANRRHETNK
jgi:hypothetical protein